MSTEFVIFSASAGNASTSSISSNTYQSGIMGNGYRIQNTPSGSFAQFDNLTIRNTLRTHIFQKDIVRATNGHLFISDCGQIVNDVNIPNTTGDHSIVIKDGTLEKNDIVWYKDANENTGNITGIKAIVQTTSSQSTISGSTVYTYKIKSYSGTGIMKSGGTIVRIGNTTDASRQGTIYLTANGVDTPYIDICQGISSSAQAGISSSFIPDTSKIKLRLGNLEGITDSQMGSISGYGLYSDNVFLKGKILAQSGQIANWNITSSSIYSGSSIYGTQNGIYFGQNGLSLSNTFKVDKTGSLYASNATLSGNITANDGKIGGWEITSNSIKKGTVVLDSNNQKIYIGTGSYNDTNTSFYVDSTGQFSLKDKLYFSGSTLTIDGTITSSAGKIGNWIIGSNTLSSGNITMSNLSGGFIKVGTLVNTTTTATANSGLYMSSSGVTLIKGGSTSDQNYILFNNNGLSIKTQYFQVTSNGGITATTGSIAGWVIDSDKIFKSNVHINSSGYISFGATPPTSYGDNVGAYLGYSSGAKLSLYKNNNNYLQWDGDKLLVKTPNFYLDSSGNITASNATLSGSISASSGTIGGWSISSESLSTGNYNTSGKMYFGTSGLSLGTNFVVSSTGVLTSSAGKIANWIIGTNMLSSGNITMSNNSGGYFKLGTITSSNPNQTNRGIYLSGSGDVLIKGSSIANSHYLLFNSDGLEISGSKFSLTTAGNLKATDVDLSGKIDATSGSIGGWTIGQDYIISNNENTQLQANGNVNFGNRIIYNTDTDKLDVRGTIQSQKFITDDNIYFNTGLLIGSAVKTNGSLYTYYANGIKYDDDNYQLCNIRSSYIINGSFGEGMIGWNFEGPDPKRKPYIENNTVIIPSEGIYSLQCESRVFVTQEHNQYGLDFDLSKQRFKQMYIDMTAYNDNEQKVNLQTDRDYVENYVQSSVHDLIDNNGTIRFIIDDTYNGDIFDLRNVVDIAYFKLTIVLQTLEEDGYVYSIGLQDRYPQYAYRNNKQIDNHNYDLHMERDGINKLSFLYNNNSGIIVQPNANNVLTVTGKSLLNGDLNVTGSICATGDIVAYASSDSRLKTNLHKLDNPLQKISLISGYEFTYTEEATQVLRNKRTYGIIAQQLKQVLPHSVKLKQNGYYGVQYHTVIPLLVQCIKQLKEQIKDLKCNKSAIH